MSTWKITIAGMYKYMEDNPLTEYHLFDQLTLPDNLADYREKIIEQILFETAERPAMYEDAMYVRYHIGVWSRNNVTRFQKLAELYNLDYNPLENYDRVEDTTMTGSYDNDGNSSSSTTSTRADDNHNFVSAYDADSMTEHSKTESSDSYSDSTSGTSHSDGTNSTHTISRVHGNIGVTTAQQMWESQYNLLEKYTHVFDSIAKDFCHTFCLNMYS